MQKIYEVECQRMNVTPKAFYGYCRKQSKKKGLDIESWVEFDSWINPCRPEKYHINKHDDWEIPQIEGLGLMPYEWHLFLQNSYNFIIEFEFDTETKGHGYFYALEYER